jgi:O-antigen ligase
MSVGERTPESRERLLFWLLVSFMLGWVLLPSDRPLYNRHHDWLAYGLVLPVAILWHGRALLAAFRTSAVLKAAAVFTAWMALSILWSRGLSEIGPVRGLLEVAAATVVPAALFVVLRGNRIETLARWMAGAAAVMASLAVVVWASGHRPWGERLGRPFNFEHPNLFGHTLAVATVLACWLAVRRSRSGKERAIWSLVTIVGLGGVVLTLGRASMVATMAGLALVVVLAGRWKLLILGGAAAIVGAVTAGDLVADRLARGDAGRDVIWTELLDRTRDRPLIGNGLRTDDGVVFAKGSSDFPRGFTMPHAHSIFVSTLFHGGAVGLGLLIGLIGLALGAAWRAWRRSGDSLALPLLSAGLVCLAVDGHRVVGNPHLSVYLLFWFPVALAAREWSGARNLPAPVRTEPPGGFLDRIPAPPAWFVIAFLVAVTSQRLLHFGPEIDDPHVWRQTDTAHYARVMAEEGLDLLRPAVCWMGDHRTVVLEFPLPEAVMALGYRVFGEDHRVARVVTLLFFAGAVFFLWLLVRELVGSNVAWWTILVLSAMPLGLFYSRAIHIDPAVLAFCHAMAWAWVVGLRRRSSAWMALGAALAVPAVLMKAPYAAVAGVPVVVVAMQEHRLRFVWRHVWMLLVPVAAFVWWRWHTVQVNGAMPDWHFIPGYRRLDHNFSWYFGSARMRLNLELWMAIASRVLTHVTGWIGLLPVVLGAGLSIVERRLRAVGAWIAALGFYVMVFFNLNYHHDYYQLPFLAPLAVAFVVGAGWAVHQWRIGPRLAVGVMTTLMVVAAAEWSHRIEASAYTVPSAFTEMGRMVREHTPDDALVVVSFGGLDCRSPHILYPAHRNGWSVPDRHLNPELLDRLVQEGATHFAAAWAGYPGDELMAHLPEERLIHHGPVGDRTVAIYRLDDGESRSLSGSATR